MKVKDLLNSLLSFDSDADVLVVFHKGVTVVDDLTTVSPGENAKLVYLETASFTAYSPPASKDLWLKSDVITLADREGNEE